MGVDVKNFASSSAGYRLSSIPLILLPVGRGVHMTRSLINARREGENRKCKEVSAAISIVPNFHVTAANPAKISSRLRARRVSQK